MDKSVETQKNILIGCRIPKDYFQTSGTGESDIAIHAGSYHLALKKANIEMCNIMTYSSILPKEANLISAPTIPMKHGCVLESIMSVCNGEKGELCSAGIIYGWLRDRKTGERFGGLVCEHNGNYTKEILLMKLKDSINELYINGFSEQYELNSEDITILTESFIPQKKYGTALVSLCFTNYIVPIV